MTDLTPETANIVMVYWRDIKFDDKWNSEKGDPLHPVKCLTVGFLIREDDEEIILASTYYDDDGACGWATEHAFSKLDPTIKIIKKGRKT